MPVAMASDQESWAYTPAFLPVSEADMSAVSAHGSVRLQELLRAGEGTQPAHLESPDYVTRVSASSGEIAGDSLSDLSTAGVNVANVLDDLLAALPDLLDMDFKIVGIKYRPGEEVVTLGNDGAIYIAFPETVEQVSIEKLNVSGGDGPPLGDINMYDLSFHRDSKIRIQGE
jgi:hypothetical protein